MVARCRTESLDGRELDLGMHHDLGPNRDCSSLGKPKVAVAAGIDES